MTNASSAARITVGAASNSHVIATRDGAALSLRIHGPADAPRLVVSHGNGLATDGYRSFWEPLADAFQVVALDLRSHGQSRGSDDAHHTWSQFYDDLETVWRHLAETLGPRPTVGVFHSLSAVASLGHVRRYGRRWDALLLFDPPIAPPEGHRLEPAHVANMTELARGARARRREFRRPAELASRFAQQPLLQRWQPEAYAAMAEAMLRQVGPHQWRLACPPELEARIFETNTDHALWSVAAGAATPCKLVCGDPALPGAQSPALMGLAAAREFGIAYEAIPETTHFLQIERADACRAIARTFCQTHVGRQS